MTFPDVSRHTLPRLASVTCRLPPASPGPGLVHPYLYNSETHMGISLSSSGFFFSSVSSLVTGVLRSGCFFGVTSSCTRGGGAWVLSGPAPLPRDRVTEGTPPLVNLTIPFSLLLLARRHTKSKSAGLVSAKASFCQRQAGSPCLSLVGRTTTPADVSPPPPPPVAFWNIFKWLG